MPLNTEKFGEQDKGQSKEWLVNTNPFFFSRERNASGNHEFHRVFKKSFGHTKIQTLRRFTSCFDEKTKKKNKNERRQQGYPKHALLLVIDLV